MEEVCGVPMRGGTLRPLEPATTEALAAPGEAARTDVHEHEVAPREETRGRQGGQRAGLGVAVPSRGTVCVVRRSRGGQGARALWGEECAGLVVTDRSRASTWYPGRWRQRCGAPGLRDVAARRGGGGRSEESGDALLAQAHPMVPWGHRVRAGTLQRATFRSSRSPLRREVERRGEAGSPCGVPPTAGTCRDIVKRREAWWTFGQVDGVEPTKNTAARAIRPGVLWSTGSVGTQSEAGSRCGER